jgi:hypothetical protein
VRKGENVSERIPPPERREIARQKRRARLQRLVEFVRGLWKGRS